MKSELLKMTLNVFYFLNAQMIVLYCTVSLLRLASGQTADFVPLIRICLTAADVRCWRRSTAVSRVLCRKSPP